MRRILIASIALLTLAPLGARADTTSFNAPYADAFHQDGAVATTPAVVIRGAADVSTSSTADAATGNIAVAGSSTRKLLSDQYFTDSSAYAISDVVTPPAGAAAMVVRTTIHITDAAASNTANQKRVQILFPGSAAVDAIVGFKGPGDNSYLEYYNEPIIDSTSGDQTFTGDIMETEVFQGDWGSQGPIQLLAGLETYTQDGTSAGTVSASAHGTVVSLSVSFA